MSLCKSGEFEIGGVKSDGFKLGGVKSGRFSRGQIILAAFAALAILPAWAQYPGQVAKTSKDTPELRAIGVLEWTGEAGKPKASRIVPVTVLDQGELQDGGIYLARPEPLALSGEVEYELEQDGKPVGLYDIRNAGQEQGAWVGYGTWKPLPRARQKPSMQEMAHVGFESDAQSDEPVLHRKHHADDAASSGTGKGSGESSGSSGDAPAADPDRPVLHKSPSSESTSDTAASSSPATDPDRPTLHKSSSAGSADNGSAGGSAAAEDPDRPVLKKGKNTPAEDTGHVESMPDITDPDRPRLVRGKSEGNDIALTPSLMGLPPDMQQAVAVSDARNRDVHVWSYAWANSDDEAKMKSALEDIARDALGLNSPPAPAPKTKRATTAKTKAKPAPPPPTPVPLVGEQFHVFELAYGSGATLVLSAHTAGPAAQEKFVTLVAQPDLYGNVLVLLKNVTDGAHLDVTPRMRLVDAVDAMADNRGELLFELRGSTQRQFALYRVLRGRAEKLFVSGGAEFASQSMN
jgi:hypothetical protein